MREESTPPAAAPAAPTLKRVFSLVSSVFALLGFAVAFVIAVPQTRDGILNQFQATAWWPVVHSAGTSTIDTLETVGPAPPAQALETGVPAAARFAARAEPRAVAAAAQDEGRRAVRVALTQYIATRYRVADEVVSDIVDVAFRAAETQALDPLVVLAVVATESGYNPIAESTVGAKGLMQIIAKFHPEKLASHGGEDALFEPEVNIRVGAQILREYLRRYGDLEVALQVYAGALDDADARYARKVLAERERLQQALERSRRQA